MSHFTPLGIVGFCIASVGIVSFYLLANQIACANGMYVLVSSILALRISLFFKRFKKMLVGVGLIAICYGFGFLIDSIVFGAKGRSNQYAGLIIIFWLAAIPFFLIRKRLFDAWDAFIGLFFFELLFLVGFFPGASPVWHQNLLEIDLLIVLPWTFGSLCAALGRRILGLGASSSCTKALSHDKSLSETELNRQKNPGECPKAKED